MARLGRYFVPDQPLHAIQRGNDRKPVFFGEDDCAQYRAWLVGGAGGIRTLDTAFDRITV